MAQQQRLFNGQIQPQARPLGSFLQPAQNNIAGASQPQLLQTGRGIVTQQQAGTSGVAGFNQIQQMADALGPFSKSLQKAVTKGMRQYAISNIEDGYYDELKNEQLRATLQLQQNQEAGAADAADTITAIEKVDPIAATLAKESNPWKLIGRKRALAQLAAGEVAARFNAELAQNAGVLASMPPGSEALMKRKADVTSGVLKDFGLSGDETEAAYYVSPQINKSWDKFTQKQSELYSEEIYRSTTALTGAAVKTRLSSLVSEGVLLSNGERIMPGDQRFGSAAGILLTQVIDKGLSLLGGKDKTKALESIRQNLGVYYAQGVPGAVTAIDNIRLGSAQLPMEQRPRWIDANPFELKDYSNKALKLQNEEYEIKQTSIKQQGEMMWNQRMSGLQVDSPEYQAEAQAIEAELDAAGYRDAAGLVSGLIDDDQAVAEGNGGMSMTFGEKESFKQKLMDLSPAALESSEDVAAVYEQARQAAMREPTRDTREAAMEEYTEIIDKKREEFATLPKNSAMRSAVNNLVKEDLAMEGIAGLKGNSDWQSGGNWSSASPGAAVTASESRYREFGNTVRTLHTQEYWKQLQLWRAQNPGMAVDPGTEAGLLVTSAAAVRESAAFKAAKDKAMQKGASAPPPAVNQDSKNGPVPAAAASSVTPEQAKSYVDKPVMNASWVRSELSAIRETYNGGGGDMTGSADLKRLSSAAGVPPERYLLEQLKFYAPKLDPTGVYRKFLEHQLQKEKSNSTPAVTYGDQSSSPRAPGAWLNQLVMPVETARLPGGEQGPVQGPFTPIKRYPSGWMPEGGEPGAPVPMPNPIA